MIHIILPSGRALVVTVTSTVFKHDGGLSVTDARKVAERIMHIEREKECKI